MAWRINNILGQVPTGLPKGRPQKLSRLLDQNPKIYSETLTLGFLSPSLRPAQVTLQPLCLGPWLPLGSTGPLRPPHPLYEPRQCPGS